MKAEKNSELYYIGNRLRIPKEQFQERLLHQIQEAKKVIALKPFSAADLNYMATTYNEWDQENKRLLTEAFSSEEKLKDYTYSLMRMMGSSLPFSAQVQTIKANLENAVTRLEEVLAELPKLEEDPSLANESILHTAASPLILVHGADLKAQYYISRYLRQAGYLFYMTHQKGPNLEKIFGEGHRVHTALCVLNPARNKNFVQKGQKYQYIVEPRDLFDLGYLVAKLGTPRVIAVPSESIHLPKELLIKDILPFSNDSSWKDLLLQTLKSKMH